MNTLKSIRRFQRRTRCPGPLPPWSRRSKKNLDKYLSIVDIGEFFKKIQVAASPNIDFGDAEFSDPINEALIQVSYPNFDEPLSRPMARSRSRREPRVFIRSGTHIDQTAPVTLASWSRDNPKDIINICVSQAGQAIGWDADQVRIKKKLIYKPDDAQSGPFQRRHHVYN